MSQQTSNLIAKEFYRDKRQCVAIENEKNLTIQLRQRKFMLRQGFSARCQHHEEFVATKKLMSRQIKQAERRNFIATRDLLSRH